MAKISALPAALGLTGTEKLPLVQGQATRGVSLAALVAFMAPLLPGWLKGDKGDTGSAANTRGSIGELMAAPIADKTSLYDGAIWTWMPGDFTGRIDGIDRVSSMYTPVAAGAWVRGRERAAVPYAVPYNRITSDRGMDRVTLHDFGDDALPPVGSGHSSADTAAFKRALDFMANYVRRDDLDATSGSRVYMGRALHVPDRSYYLDEPIWTDVPDTSRIMLRGAGVNSTAIHLPAGSHFLQTTNRIESVYLAGFTLFGGLGVLHHTSTIDNVAQEYLIEDCFFFGYKGACIASEALDMPYWIVRRNIFAGDQAGVGAVRGVVLGGLLDNSVLEDNRFLNNDFGVVLGPVHSGSVRIQRNDFISAFQADRTLADIWIRPNDGSISAASPSGANLFRVESGLGYAIMHNKFGGEGITNYARKSPKILIAAGTAGERATSQPDLTWKSGADGKHYLSGLKVRGNTFGTANTTLNGIAMEGADANVMDVYVGGLDRVHWSGDNDYAGSSFRYIVEHKDGGARVPSAMNMNWNVSIPPYGIPARLGFTNSPVGHIRDLSGEDASPYSIAPGTTAIDHVLGSVSDPSGWIVSGGVSKTGAVPNADGANDATAFHFDGTAGAIQYGLPGPMTGKVGRAGRIVGRYKMDGAVPRRVHVYMNAAGRDLVSKTIVLQPVADFQILSIPCPWPADAIYALFTIASVDQVDGDTLTLGDFKFTSGKGEPQV